MAKIRYENLDKTEAFRELRAGGKQVDLREALTADRVEKYVVNAGAGISYHYAAKQVDDGIIATLQALADEQQLIENPCDRRRRSHEHRRKPMVLHHLVRGELGNDVIFKGKDLAKFYKEQQDRIELFASKVHRGELRGRPVKHSTLSFRSVSGVRPRTSGALHRTGDLRADEPRRVGDESSLHFQRRSGRRERSSAGNRPRENPFYPRLEERDHPGDADESTFVIDKMSARRKSRDSSRKNT